MIDRIRNALVPTEVKATNRQQPQQRGRTVMTGFHARGPKGVPDAERLRAWVQTNPFVYAAINAIRAQVANADWDIIPTAKGFDPKIQAQIKHLLEAPNVDGRNNSFNALLGPVVADILTLDLGAIMPIRTFGGKNSSRGPISSLRHADGARVEFLPGWQSNADGPRYRYYLDNAENYVDLENSELITIVANPQTWGETGLAPLRVLHDTLQADYDTFRSVHMLQKKRSPQGIMLVPNADAETIMSMSRLFEQEIEGRSGIGFFNIEDARFLPLGSTNVMSQGVEWFMDLVIKRVCAAFGVSPITIGITDTSNRASSQAQMAITEDIGLVPLMKLIQGYINREIIAPFGDPYLQFVFQDLIPQEEGQSAEQIRVRSGPNIILPTFNELREADGLSPMYNEPDAPASMKMLFNQPLIQYGALGPLPSEMYYDMLEKDLQMKDAQIALTKAQAENFTSEAANYQAQAQSVLNPPEPKPAATPEPTKPETDEEATPPRRQPKSHPFEDEFNDLKNH